jgi:hypothetical protein
LQETACIPWLFALTCHVFWLSAYKQQPNFFVFTGLKKSLSSPFLLYDAGRDTPEGILTHDLR